MGGIPSEKHSQQYERQREPNGEPDQRAAEDLFGAASVTQGPQQEGKKQAYQAVAEIECNTFKRKHCSPPVRFDEGVQIIREEKANRDHRGTKREGEYHTPPPPTQRQSSKGRQSNNRDPDEVSCWRATPHHPLRDRRDKEAERSKRRPDQTVTGCRQVDQPEVRAREREEQSDHRVEEHACKNHEECERRVGNPRSRSQHSLDRGFLRRLRSVICARGVALGFPVWLPHTEGDNERERGRDEVKINWKTQSRALRESYGGSERAGDCIYKPGIIDRAADEHRDNHSYRLVAGDLVEYLWPFRGSSALGEGIEDERLVRAARQALGDSAEQSVRQAKEKEQRPAAGRRHAEGHHFYHHGGAGRNDERPTSDPIRERAGWQVRADDGYCPREIQQGILRRTQAEVEEQHCQDRVIEPRVKEYAEKDKAPPVASGGIIGIESTHSSCTRVLAFAPVAIAYRNSLLIVTVVVLASVFLLAGVAYTQEPALPSMGARTRLVVGLAQSPPFCMRSEDGSWSGISVELWHWIAADLGIDTEFRESTLTGLFDDLAPGRPLDVSIGALTITAEREDRLDFSQSFFLSGLSVAVKTAPGEGGLLAWVGRVLVWNFWRIVAALITSLVLVALLIWALEHKSNPKEFGGDGKLHRGIGSALWWSAVTMTTVGYGDLAPRSPAGRLVAIAWMFVSLLLVSWFTASMASILTAERLDAGTGGLVVRGPDDLRHLHVGVIAGTSSEDYLRRARLTTSSYLRTSC